MSLGGHYLETLSPPLQVIAHLKRSGKDVPPDYEDDFRRADQTFLYQLVFDPRSQSQVRLNTPPSHLDAHQLDWAGTYPLYYLFVFVILCLCFP